MDVPWWGLKRGDFAGKQGDLVAAEMREGYAAARQAVRRVAGIRMLLGLLHARSSMPAGQVDRLRALAVRCLLGLAHEPQLRHILAKLQVCPFLCLTDWALHPVPTWSEAVTFSKCCIERVHLNTHCVRLLT